jgi:stage III sporulation protein AA
MQLLNKISHFSMYTLEEELRRGYVTIDGGHRIGLAGKVILENGQVKAIRDVSSFNIRIAKERIGISDKLIPYLFQGDWLHTMIIGPPQTGKTTLLRDIARIISSGDPLRGYPPFKVGIVDERSEIAGCVKGIPQLTFGHRVDVLDACPKAEGMMMMIRSMSPDVLIVDEIGRIEDAEAIMEAVNAGIKLIMTTHGTTLSEIQKRPSLRSILDQRLFQRYIELSRENGPGTITYIKDRSGIEIFQKVSVT